MLLNNITLYTLMPVHITHSQHTPHPQARDKQMARLQREEQLAGQQIQLANGKRLRLADLQGSSRVVLVAGTTQQVCARASLELHIVVLAQSAG